MSQAPGLSGTPDCGHCSRAMTRASCARSSARPTSRTIRISPAISRGDSIRQTASMARWVSVATHTHHTILNSSAQAGRSRRRMFLCRTQRLYALLEVFRSEHLANSGFALPSRPVFLVEFHEAPGPFNRFLPRFQLKLGVAADDFFGFGEGSVDYGELSAGKPYARALRGGGKSPAAEHRARLDCLLAQD